MKKVMFLTCLLATLMVQGQRTIQPLSSGDYWEINDYQRRLPELANDNTFPRVIQFPNGYAGVDNIWVNRIVGANELHWSLAGVQNVSDFYVEYSRDMHQFEQAGIVNLVRVNNGTDYVFRHQFYDKRPVYYRLALVQNGRVLAYTPAVQVAAEQNQTKVYPTVVKTGTFYVQAGFPYQLMQVVNGAGQTVFEKALDGRTGTVTVVLPDLASGAYFVNLLSNRYPVHVQRIVVE